ncbi:MAG: SET domain-containing protein [Pseudomonadota bacterium]
MLTFKSEVRKSAVHGQGLFTLEPLKAEQILFAFDPIQDKKYTPAEFHKLPELEQRYLNYWGYHDTMDDCYYLGAGNDQYTNHSTTPSTYVDSEGNVRASHDIPVGGEITCDYTTFDKLSEYKLVGTGARDALQESLARSKSSSAATT